MAHFFQESSFCMYDTCISLLHKAICGLESDFDVYFIFEFKEFDFHFLPCILSPNGLFPARDKVGYPIWKTNNAPWSCGYALLTSSIIPKNLDKDLLSDPCCFVFFVFASQLLLRSPDGDYRCRHRKYIQSLICRLIFSSIANLSSLALPRGEKYCESES